MILGYLSGGCPSPSIGQESRTKVNEEKSATGDNWTRGNVPIAAKSSQHELGRSQALLGVSAKLCRQQNYRLGERIKYIQPEKPEVTCL